MKDEFMEIKIYSTKNYGIFKIMPSNRRIKSTKALAKSMNEINLLCVRPIIVDEDMYIIDGQHRLEVCKENNLIVYYVILPREKCDAKKAMMELNVNQHGWRVPDYVHHWAKEGKKAYVELENFTKKNGISPSYVYVIFGRSELTSKILRNGKDFKINERAQEIADFLNSEEVISTELKEKSFVQSIRRVFDTWSDKNIAKLKKNIRKVERSATIEQYMLQYERVIKKVRSRK